MVSRLFAATSKSSFCSDWGCLSYLLTRSLPARRRIGSDLIMAQSLGENPYLFPSTSMRFVWRCGPHMFLYLGGGSQNKTIRHDATRGGRSIHPPHRALLERFCFKQLLDTFRRYIKRDLGLLLTKSHHEIVCRVIVSPRKALLVDRRAVEVFKGDVGGHGCAGVGVECRGTSQEGQRLRRTEVEEKVSSRDMVVFISIVCSA